jgi:hypothetical protein
VTLQRGVYQTPKIYIEGPETRVPLPRLSGVPGFVGLAQRGPLNSPQPLTSWGQFGSIFGRIQDGYFLGPAVYGFFANGGMLCYATRVADTETETKRPVAASYLVYNQAGKGVIQIDALDEGTWGNDIMIEVEPGTEKMALSRLQLSASQGTDVLFAGSTVDLHAGSLVTLVRKNEASVREEVEIQEVRSSTEIKLTRRLEKGFPKESLVLGYGFNLTIAWTEKKESFVNLSLNEDHERFLEYAINGDEKESSYIARMAQGHSILVRARLTTAGREPPVRPFRDTDTVVQQTQGKEAQVPIDFRYFTGYHDGSYFPQPDPAAHGYQGLAALETVEEIDLVSIPDLNKSQEAGTGVDRFNNFKQAQYHIVQHCETMANRFAILDAPPMDPSEVHRPADFLTTWAEDLGYASAARYGAMYFPWIRINPIEDTKPARFIPPSGHVAGVYARSDAAQGVHKAPANEILREVYQVQYAIDDEIQALLNPAGVNCIRSLPGRGIRVWGARTLSREAQWRYLTVRRVSVAITREMLTSLAWTVFEPNDARLWSGITSTLNSLLRGLFQRGMLAGTMPEQAFYVKCDAETNPPEAIHRGEVTTEVGFAPVHPAEFIAVLIKRTPESLKVREAS